MPVSRVYKQHNALLGGLAARYLVEDKLYRLTSYVEDDLDTVSQHSTQVNSQVSRREEVEKREPQCLGHHSNSTSFGAYNSS